MNDPYYISCYNRTDIKWEINKLKDHDELNCYCLCPLEYMCSFKAVNANIERHYYRCDNCLQVFIQEKGDCNKNTLFLVQF